MSETIALKRDSKNCERDGSVVATEDQLVRIYN